MTIEITIPDIGVDEVEVTEILVKVGDNISEEQSLITVEGDKVSMEIPSPRAGVVKDIRVSVGDKVNTGKLIMVFDSDKNTSDVLIKEKEKTIDSLTVTSQVIKNVYIPNINSDKAEVSKILVREGDEVKKKQSLIVLKVDKIFIEVISPLDGIIKEIKVNIGDLILSGSLVLVFQVECSFSDTSQSEKEIVAQIKESPLSFAIKKDEFNFTKNDSYVHATPKIRRLAREFGVNLSKVKGTGRKNRILYEDVRDYVKEIMQCTESITSTLPIRNNINYLPWPKIDFRKFGEVEEVELSRVQKVSGANLSRNWMMVPHVTHFDRIDITETEEFRQRQNAEAEKSKLGIKITSVIFAMKAVSYALKIMPRFNSTLSEDGQYLILKKYINIGVAVDTPNGLVVPVFKDVHKKSITELSRELMVIVKKARNGNLTLDEMQGGCFTISSIGNLGTAYFSPIINVPEVAILGLSKASTEAVWNGKEFLPRLILPISLSFDHRVIDGADGARFITIISNVLSDIRQLII